MNNGSPLRVTLLIIIVSGAIALSGCGGQNQGESRSVKSRELAEFAHSDRIFLETDPAARRFQAFFIEFEDAVKAGKVFEIYARDAYLDDSLKEVRGADAIDSYFRKTLEMATLVRVSFRDAAVSGENYYFRWVMDVQAPKLNGGNTVRSIGMTHVLFDEDGRVAMHQDYWDAASGLFEHLPLFGSAMSWVKTRL